MDIVTVNIKFRNTWCQGIPGCLEAKDYFNLLVDAMIHSNYHSSVREIVRIILIENCDLPGISEWKLLSNLNEKNAKQLLSE